MSGFRRIVVDGVDYSWKCGPIFLEVRKGRKKIACVSIPVLLGITWDTLERGIHKRTPNISVGPGHVERIIREGMCKACEIRSRHHFEGQCPACANERSRR